MLALVVRCIAELGFTNPLHYVADLLTAGDAPAIAQPITSANLPPGCSLEEFLLTNFDVPLFDLGLDQTGLNLGKIDRVTDWPRDLRYSLGAVARFLVRCVDRGDALRGDLPEFIVITPITTSSGVHRPVSAGYDTPFATHVRKGRRESATTGSTSRINGSTQKMPCVRSSDMTPRTSLFFHGRR